MTRTFLAALLLTATPALAETPSAFGCTGIEFNPTLPAVEGKEGVFYRTMSDLRLQHPMRGEVMALMERLAAALAANGTTLVFATIPAKSLAMPQYLPDRARDYGYDPAIAETVYDDIITRLGDAGILAPDIRRALQSAPQGEKVFYPTDFHWTSSGARLAAQAIGDAIRAHPAYAETTPGTYESRELGIQPAFQTIKADHIGAHLRQCHARQRDCDEGRAFDHAHALQDAAHHDQLAVAWVPIWPAGAAVQRVMVLSLFMVPIRRRGCVSNIGCTPR